MNDDKVINTNSAASGKAAARSCASHEAGEIGYCQFLQPVAHEQLLYLHPATVTDEDVERAMEAADLVFAKHFGTRPDADEIDTAMVRAALESFANKETP